MSTKYFAPHGGHPGQEQLLTDRAVFTDAYAVIPKGTMRDIVTSFLPFWEGTRLWIIARPLSGFAETFSQYIMEVQPGGGSDRAELDPEAEAVLFVVEGAATLQVDGQTYELTPGGYAYLPYGYGYNEPGGRFRTMMSIRQAGVCPRVLHFSNPEVKEKGRPTGVAHTRADSADSARAIDSARQLIASYR